MKTLMIKTKDASFFTYQNNLSALVEFAKTFNAALSLVELKTPVKLLNLEDLAIALCDPSYNSPKPEYNVDTVLLPNVISDDVKDFIRKSLTSKSELSLIEIKNAFPNLSSTYISNQFSQIRKKMKTEGFHLLKIGSGKYKLE